MLSLSTSIVYSSSYSSQEINIGETTNPLPQINTSFNEIVKIDDAYFYPTSSGGKINAFYTNISNRVGDYAQNWSFQPQIPLINSSYTLHIRAEDAAGNILDADLSFKANIDIYPIELLSPRPAGFSDKKPFNFTIGVPDLTLKNESCRYKLYKYGQNPCDGDLEDCFNNFKKFEKNDSSFSSYTGTTYTKQFCKYVPQIGGGIQGDSSICEEGYNYEVMTICNSSTEGYFYNYFPIGFDNTAPTISVSADPEVVTSAVNPVSTIIINSYNDPITCKVEGEGDINNPDNFNSSIYGEYKKDIYIPVSFSSLKEGIYKYNVSCVNPAGVLTKKIVSIIYEPEINYQIEIISPRERELVKSNSVNISVKVKGVVGNIECNYTIFDRENIIREEGSLEYIRSDEGKIYSKIVYLYDGNYKLNVNCKYYNINLNQNVDFLVDTTPPTFMLLNITDPTCSLDEIGVIINSSDLVSGIDELCYNISYEDEVIESDCDDIDDGRESKDIEIDLTENKTYEIDLYVRDKAGYSSNVISRSVKALGKNAPECDHTPPIITIHQRRSNGYAYVNLSCYDIGSGCEEYIYYDYNSLCSADQISYYFSIMSGEEIEISSSTPLCWIGFDKAGNIANGSTYIDLQENISCESDSDCPSGYYCIGGECVQCLTNADCLAGYECINGECLPPNNYSECQSDYDCDYGFICVNGECISSNQSSNQSNNQSTGCSSDNDCEVYEMCDKGECVKDMDGDGIPDYWESIYCDGDCDPDEDIDGDGLTNLQEYLDGTDPTIPEKEGKSGLVWVYILISLLVLGSGGGVGYYFYKKKSISSPRKRRGPLDIIEEMNKPLEGKVKESSEIKNVKQNREERIRKALKEAYKKRKIEERKNLLNAFKTERKNIGETKVKKEMDKDKEIKGEIGGSIGKIREKEWVEKEAKKGEEYIDISKIGEKDSSGEDPFKKLKEIAKPKEDMLNKVMGMEKKKALKWIEENIENGKIEKGDAFKILMELKRRGIIEEKDMDSFLSKFESK